MNPAQPRTAHEIMLAYHAAVREGAEVSYREGVKRGFRFVGSLSHEEMKVYCAAAGQTKYHEAPYRLPDPPQTAEEIEADNAANRIFAAYERLYQTRGN